MKILDGILVLECTGSVTAANIGLRLSELGARVVRVVESSVGDKLQQSAMYGQYYDGKSILCHSKSRGKELWCGSALCDNDLALLNKMLGEADIVIYDINDNVLNSFGVDTCALRKNFPKLIEAEFSDYGSHTLYRNRKGDDLLVQALSGITWLSGNRDDAPTPMGFKVASQFCSTYLTQGILAALYRREAHGGAGMKVSSSLLEAIIQVQLEVITTSANSGMETPVRTKRGNTHAGLPAPYGVYRSKDGFFAMSFVAITLLTDVMGLEIPDEWRERESWLWYRDEIMAFLEPHFLKRSNQEWLDLFTPLDIWCSDINDLPTTLALEAYESLDIEESFPICDKESFSAFKLPYSITTNPIEGDYVVAQSESTAPYDGLMVIDISQYLSGPSSTLQLSDFGATVVKIERPNGGDMGRNVIISNLLLDDTSSSFLAVGRNKRSAALDLKSEADIKMVKELMRQADVIVQNFRPSVMKRLGLDYETIKEMNPRVIYAEISGYGDKGCWVNKPGQDYIVQALSGLCMLSGESDHEPVPMGLSVVDLIAGCHLDEAVTAAIYNRSRRGEGAHIKVTMLGSAMDLQSDFVTAYRWDNSCGVERQSISNANPGEDAPYGIYKTCDGYIAISAAPLDSLIEVADIPHTTSWCERQEAIKEMIATRVATVSTTELIAALSNIEGCRCSEILNWKELFASPQGESLDMLQRVERGNGFSYTTTRCPVRFNDKIMKSELGAPRVGEYTKYIIDNYNLKN